MMSQNDFLKNKYTKWYFSIISNAQQRTPSGYIERHHIIPKSLGGNNSKSNLVKLSAREHFICHWLLTKMVDNIKQKYQMWNAFSCMLYRKNDHQKRYKITSKIFENIKKEGTTIKSILFSGENNPMHGVRGHLHPSFGKKWSDEMRANSSNAHKGQTRSYESRKKQSEKMTGRKQSLEHISKRIKPGRNHSTETKEKIRKSILNVPPCVCEHCGISASKGNYKRWHGDNCRNRQGERKFLA